MYVCVEMYENVSITIGCRWKLHCVLNTGLYKYRKVENLWDNRKMKTTTMCMFLLYGGYRLSMVSCGDRICNVNEVLDRYNVF